MVWCDKMEITKNGDKRISVALMAPFVILTFQYFILVSLNLIETSSAARVQLVSKLLVAMVFVYAFPVIWKRSKVKLLGTYYLWSFIFFFHYLIFPDNRMYMHELIFPLFFMCLPVFIYSWSVYNWDVLKKVMHRASVLVFWMGAVLTILIFSSRASIGTYSMALSYYIRKRHKVRPGLTGLAQINGRNALGWEQRFAYDIQYSKQITFANDINIILSTILKVLLREDIVVRGTGSTQDFHVYRLSQRNGNS